MSRTRKIRRPIEELDVTIVPDDYEPPFHYLREWREFKGLTLEQFAELVGTSKGNASDLENGKRELGMKWLWRISEALRIRPGFILEHDPNDLPNDVLEIWATISDEDKPRARKALEIFVPTPDDLKKTA